MNHGSTWWLVACLLVLVLVAPVGASKPDVPVDVKVELTGTVDVGAPVVVTATVTPRVAAPRMTVEFRLPEGVTLQGESATWDGRAVESAVVTHAATVVLNARRRVVASVLVGLHFDDGSRVFKAVEVVLAPPGMTKAVTVRPVVTRAGARVIEHGGVER